MRIAAFLLMSGLIALMAGGDVAFAATYRWENSEGVVSFTDNPESIPPQYRKKSRKVEADETVAPPESAVEPPPQQESAAGVAEQSAPPPVSQEKGREYWQMRYSALRGEIAAIKEGLPDKMDRMKELRHEWLTTQKRSERQSLNRMEDEIARDEERVRELERQLEQLDVEAAKSAVPFEWRK